MKQLIAGWGLIGSLLFSPLALANATPGEPSPAFRATDAAGHAHTLTDYIGSWIVLEWYLPQCDQVSALYDSGELPEMQSELRDEGVEWLTIISSPPGPDNLISAEEALALADEQELAASAPFLLDETSVVALAYGVRTAPQFFVISPRGELVYAGALRERDADTSQNHVRTALESAMADEPVELSATQAYGCEVEY